MSVQVQCPACHHENIVDETAFGTHTLCEKCRRRFYVVAPTLESKAPLYPVESFSAALQPTLESVAERLSWVIKLAGATLVLHLILIGFLVWQAIRGENS
jgi:hypothetical protein